MVRLNTSVFILSTIIVALMANSVFAKVTINTPLNDLPQGSEYDISWSSDGDDTSSTGSLRAENNETSSDTTISDNLDLSSGSYTWKVNVDPGIYHFVLTVDDAIYYSGNFKVVSSESSESTTTINTAKSTSVATASNKSNANTKSTSATDSVKKSSTTSSATTTKQTTTTTPPSNPAPNAGSGAQTLKPNLLNLCLGLGAIASVLIKYF